MSDRPVLVRGLHQLSSRLGTVTLVWYGQGMETFTVIWIMVFGLGAVGAGCARFISNFSILWGEALVETAALATVVAALAVVVL